MPERSLHGHGHGHGHGRRPAGLPLVAVSLLLVSSCSDDDFGQERLLSDAAAMQVGMPDMTDLTRLADLASMADMDDMADLLSAPTCSDNIANGMETDVDCGGPACPKCQNGLMCDGAADCQSGTCKVGACMMKMGCDGLRLCIDTCAADLVCQASCFPQVTTTGGATAYFALSKCVAVSCPPGKGGICELNGANYNAASCLACKKSAEMMACAPPFSACLNDA